MRELALAIGLSAGVDAWLIDRVTKELVRNGTISNGSTFFSWLQITHHQNHGLMANVPLPSLIIIILSLVAMGFVIYGLHQAYLAKRFLDVLSLAVILGAALGNFYDRLVLGYVFDWLMFFNTSILNLADIFIGLGVALYVYNQLRSINKTNQPVNCQKM